MIDLQAWFSAHPYAASLIGWLVLSLLFWAFRPRNSEEYDKLPPRLAAFLQMLRAVFGDGAKIIEAARKVFNGASYPKPAVELTLTIDDESVTKAVERLEQRGAASLGLLAGLGLAVVGVLCAWLSACTPHAGAATLSAAQRIEKQRVDYRAAVLACASQHSQNCAEFDRCQKAEALKRNLALVRTSCVEATPAEAADAGLLDGARQ